MREVLSQAPFNHSGWGKGFAKTTKRRSMKLAQPDAKLKQVCKSGIARYADKQIPTEILAGCTDLRPKENTGNEYDFEAIAWEIFDTSAQKILAQDWLDQHG
jgi:hypothetical protein